MESLFRLLRRGRRYVMGGDWNCVVREDECEKNFDNKFCKALKDSIKDLDYVDAIDCLEVEERSKANTFTFQRPGSSFSRLDRFYFPHELKGKIVNVTNFQSLSDHQLVKVTCKFECLKV